MHAAGRAFYQAANSVWLTDHVPRLNPIERVWRHLKDKLSNHRWWADLPALERATGALLEGLRAAFHRPGRGIHLVHNICICQVV
jgi:hypothetical protein